MPLSDFVRYLNEQNVPPAPGMRSTTPFVSENGQVYVHFAKLRLESFYSPLIDVAGGELRGHAAGLNAFGVDNRQLLEPEAVFVLPSDDGEFIYLDRLVRTLHTLNYLIYAPRSLHGTLLLRVHPRHVASVVADHGLAFEEVLRACGLMPAQITLELEVDGVEDCAHLVRAVANYKARGYGIAVGRFGRRAVDFALLREIGPALVKLDAQLVAANRPLSPLIDRLHELGAQVVIESPDTAALREQARARGVDLLQLSNPLRA